MISTNRLFDKKIHTNYGIPCHVEAVSLKEPPWHTGKSDRSGGRGGEGGVTAPGNLNGKGALNLKLHPRDLCLSMFSLL